MQKPKRKPIPIPENMLPKIRIFLQTRDEAGRILVQYCQGYLDGMGLKGGYTVDLKDNKFVPTSEE